MSQARSYLGLRGTNLNIAIGFIAGLDFLYAFEVPTSTVFRMQ